MATSHMQKSIRWRRSGKIDTPNVMRNRAPMEEDPQMQRFFGKGAKQ